MDFELHRTVEILSRTPKTLRSLLGGLSAPWLEQNEGPDTFSPHDVLGHLIHGEEEDWVPRLRIILEHGETRAFDPFDRFAFREKYRGSSTEDLLEAFETLRGKNLQYVEGLNLQPEQMALKGRHPGLGPVTLGQLLATWAVHDLGHLAQIARVMAKQYVDAVGPWREYNTILG